MGGSGKTPVTLYIAGLLKDLGFFPMILTRGYGGKSKGPLQVDPDQHIPSYVGEESLLLARHYPTFLAARRADALSILPKVKQGILLLDDGHQHTSLSKDISLLVINHQQQLGNGLLFPAGPLREPLSESFSKAHGLIYILDTHGFGTKKESDIDSYCKTWLLKDHGIELLSSQHPIFSLSSHFYCSLAKGTPVIGFAAIGYPQRFQKTLEGLSLELKAFLTFPDHWFYNQNQEQELIKLSHQHQARLITSEKNSTAIKCANKIFIKIFFNFFYYYIK